MLVPGMTFTAGGRTNATIGATTVATSQNQGGFGFIGANLAIDTDAPAGTSFVKGFRLNASGALYGKTAQLATDAWIEGIRVSALGQIVYESADPDHFASGNPITPAGNFAVN
jgi:hypothetical protein